MEEMFGDDFSDEGEGLMGKFHRKARLTIPSASREFHVFIAMMINIFALLSASPFNIFPKYTFGIYFLISVLVAWRYIFNYKTYSVFEFEGLYEYLNKKSLM